MSKTRVKKGEKYYLINTTLGTLEVDYLRDWRTGEDDAFFKTGNYFHTKEQAESMARKLRAVLKGAEVIEMPSKEDFERIRPHHSLNMYDENTNDKADGWQGCYRWLKSKIVK